MLEYVWKEFCIKMKQDSLCDSDFADDMRLLLRPLLCGPGAAQRREKFLSSLYEIYESNAKCSVLLHCPDDDYRFDFSIIQDEWRLLFIECITLPVHDIAVLPYTDFKALPEKEAEIRREKEISRLIYFYNQFKKLLGQQKAIEMFYDGAGEVLGARSWVPFFDGPRSYIAYAAWMENRIYGEHVELLEFNEKCCRLRFHGHLWRKIYQMTGHIENMIHYEEYMNIFESIWKNRASESGWTLQFIYHNEDTELVFTNFLCPHT